MINIRYKIMIFCQIVIIISAIMLASNWQKNLPPYPDDNDIFIYNNETGQTDRQNITIINSEEEWAVFSEKVVLGMDYSDYVVILNADLDFSGYSIEPVGNYHNPFRGKFDGNCHTISGLTMRSDKDYVGLFGVTQDAVIQYLKLSNCDIQSSDAMGTGGIVGLADNCTITHCSYNGYVYGQSGSVGGIAGNNWSVITFCSVFGTISGSTQDGAYSLHLQWNSYGTGGISGDNGNSIRYCKNNADIFDNTETHESNTARSGGISGTNSGIIDSCSNYGNVTGGGICKNNDKYGQIRFSFNMGSVYSGIAIGSYKDSTIDYSVNLGNTSGRYAGDIVSFWGQDSEENLFGTISNCLYINSSGSGAVRSSSFESASLKLNAKIANVVDDDRKSFDMLIDSNEYDDAYCFLLKLEYDRRKTGSIIMIVSVSLLIISFNGFLLIRKRLMNKTTYNKGLLYYKNKEFWESYKLLSTVPEYKDSKHIIKELCGTLFSETGEGENIKFGEFMGETLSWKKITVGSNNTRFLASRAIFVSEVNDDTNNIRWESTRLYKELNTVYKKLWFGESIDSFVHAEITLPNVGEIIEVFPTNEQRQCKSFLKNDSAISSGGNVYWWLTNDEATGFMPFVTADGLIIERGKAVTTDNFAVRPLFIIKEVL